MNRIDAIKHIIEKHQNALFVISNGLNSRETDYYLRADNHLYLLHAMGEALSVGIGLKTVLNTTEIVVIDGDGNALMGSASWSLLPVNGLYYYVLANGQYETTGGQNVPELPNNPHIKIITIESGKNETPNPSLPEEIISRFQNYIKNVNNTGDKDDQ